MWDVEGTDWERTLTSVYETFRCVTRRTDPMEQHLSHDGTCCSLQVDKTHLKEDQLIGVKAHAS